MSEPRPFRLDGQHDVVAVPSSGGAPARGVFGQPAKNPRKSSAVRIPVSRLMDHVFLLCYPTPVRASP